MLHLQAHDCALQVFKVALLSHAFGYVGFPHT
jgi:hypothetical protein